MKLDDLVIFLSTLGINNVTYIKINYEDTFGNTKYFTVDIEDWYWRKLVINILYIYTEEKYFS